MYHCCQFPRQVDRVADAGVHALRAYGTVDMRGVAQYECAAFAEMIRDPVMYAVSREPVHALDIDLHPIDHALAHIVPGQIRVIVFRFLAYRADQPRSALCLQREYGQKVGDVQSDMNPSVERFSAPFHVGDVEQMLILSTLETDTQFFAHE